MSRILDVYSELEAMGVASSKPLRVFGLSALPESMQTAHLPARLLLPLSPNAIEGRDGHHIDMGNRLKVTWNVNDLMLWQASEQGVGLREFAGELVSYCGNYADAMKEKKCLGGCVVRSFTVHPGVFEWPAMSGRYFAGVLAEITVEELL